MKTLNYKKLSFFLFLMEILSIIFIFGIVSNFIVVTNNNCKMPVIHYNYSDERHFSYDDKTSVNYWFLSDIIFLPDSIFSIGDLIMLITFSIMFVLIIKYIIFGGIYEKNKLGSSNK